MEIFHSVDCICLAIAAIFVFLMWRTMYLFWILPNAAYRKLRANGFSGPDPSFPLGNITEMKAKEERLASPGSAVSHDIHSVVFPYFARWQRSYGKIFIYWVGTEPFLYIAEPEFVRKMSAGVLGKSWGKPGVFKNDREPMFGNGLIMVEGHDWVRHRHLATPAFSPQNLKGMIGLMVESAAKMLDSWTAQMTGVAELEIDLEKEIIAVAVEVIAKTSFGLTDDKRYHEICEKLRAMQVTLFQSSGYLGVPMIGNLSNLKRNLRAKQLGKEVDRLLLSLIDERRRSSDPGQSQDLLGMLLAEEGGDERGLSDEEVVDECRTFFFAGHETSALAITWTLLLLAMHPEWQQQLREEIREVVGDGEVDATLLDRLEKTGWVMNEVFRLYPPAPNTQRQARQDIRVDDLIIPKGTNIWIDTVSMHHDKDLWGDDAHEFRPERFKDDLYGGCKHKMGYLTFGFGGRMCIGRNLSVMEYKVVLVLLLRRFSFSLSLKYTHSPSILLTLRTEKGLPLVLKNL